MSPRDILVVFIVLTFSMAIGLFLIKFSTENLVSGLLNVSEINNTPGAKSSISAIKTGVTDKFDYIFFAMYIGLILVLVIVSWFFSENPIFIFVFILLMILAIVISPIFSNVWAAVSQNAKFGGLVTTMPITNHIMNLLPLYVSIAGLIGILVMFGKPFVQRGQP